MATWTQSSTLNPLASPGLTGSSSGKMATLVNKQTGDRQAVGVGSQDAQKLFGQGYVLETQAPAAPTSSTAPAAPVSPTSPTAPVTSAPQVSQTGGMQPGSQTAFYSALAQIQSKGSEMNNLQTQKNLLLKARYDQNLTPEELRTLSPSQQAAIRDGQNDMIDYQIMSINDIVKGRADANQTSLQYIVEGYKADLAAAQEKQATAQQNVMSFIEKYGGMSGVDQTELQNYLDTGELSASLAIQLTNAAKTAISESGTDLTGPSSYQEWVLAGGELGTGKSYAQYLSDSNAPRSTLTPSEEAGLRKEIAADKSITQYQSLQGTYNSMNSLYDSVVTKGTSDSRASLDQAIITLFNKMLDPTSVVREGEYARTGQGQAIISQAEGFLAQLQSGGAGITDATRKDMVDVAKVLADVAKKSFDQSVSFYVPTIEKYGLDPSEFIKGYESSSESITAEEESGGMSYSTVEEFIKDHPEYKNTVDTYRESNYSDDDIMRELEQVFNSDLSMSGKGSSIINKIASNYDIGDKGGQCGHFVNENTGLKMGNTYASKMAYVDPTISVPKSGDVFVMPYKSYGHTGVVQSVIPKNDGTYDIKVIDSNWSLDEKVKTHTINSSKISGYARIG